MFCQKCGKYNLDNKEKCVYCGGALSKTQTVKPKQTEKTIQSHDKVLKNRVWFGVFFGLFLGLLGLLIGVCVFRGYEKETFLKGWWRVLFICLLIGVFSYVVFDAVESCILSF